MLRRLFLLFSGLLLVTPASAFEVSGGSWNFPTATFTVSFDGLSPSGESWSNAFKRALSEWSVETAFEFNASSGFRDPCTGRNTSAFGDGASTAAFTTSQCGAAFGSNVLAVTLKTISCANAACTGNRTITESDIVFNQNVEWDVYSGAVRSGVRDFHRVALHELGHALGLEHESDEPAIMQPFISSLDTLQRDDINGANSVYGKEATFPSIYGVDIILPSASEITASSGSVSLTGVLSQSDGKLDNRPIDIYQFTLPRDYMVDLRVSSTDLNSLLYLVRINSTQGIIPEYSFSSHNSGSDSDARINTVLAAGTYWAGVTSADGAETGGYSVSLLANAEVSNLSEENSFVSVFGAAIQVNPNPIITGELSGSDFRLDDRFLDVYQIAVDSPVTLKFALSSNAIDTKLLLVQVNGDQSLGPLSLENDDNGSGTNSTIEALLQPGTYWIGVTSFSTNATGNYRLDTTVVLP